VPVDAMQLVHVGIVTVKHRRGISRQELREVVLEQTRPYACEWGATHLLAPSIGLELQVPRSASLIPSQDAEVVYAYRKARAGEATPTALALGIDEASLKKKVSFDTGCPEAFIEVLRKHETQGQGSYELRACDHELEYTRSGTVFEKAGD
jgi:hypothetical protein